MRLQTLQVHFANLPEQIKTAGFFIRDGGATERSFRKMELLGFEEGEENNAPIDFDDGDDYDDEEEDDEEDNDLYSGCYENPIAKLLQPCGHMIFPNCVKKNNCQICGY